MYEYMYMYRIMIQDVNDRLVSSAAASSGEDDCCNVYSFRSYPHAPPAPCSIVRFLVPF